MTLAQRLGFGPDERLLIINADDYGMSRAANTGITSLLAARAISSATVMPPCPWAPDAIATAVAGGYDVGVHLTLTSEWAGYRWGPVSTGRPVPSLTDAAGYFPADCASVELTADPDEIRVELTAQIERALALGLDPSHADNHMGSLYGLATGRDFLDVTLAVCARFGLPFRLPRRVDGLGLPDEAQGLLDHHAELADQYGVVILDRLWTLPFTQGEGETYESFRADFTAMLERLRPGVTEVYLHPFTDDDELRSIMPHHRKRGWELRLMTDPQIQRTLAGTGVTRIGWSDLRDLQRSR
ncbi:polysaccharide deacetylase family protein [Streptacidiphilus sp. P02-A3a]|uniref:polysaccharide deacetylase family protein n=1 Tax=Streptacidiphilus sp. P02-A3a TaxID=2704468 RepID=UPI0015F7B335|nr:polysaccharide deacetylase family protein [Streptacidiphilus sp. P02-A3a]QMU72455.1 ChbG/HpnK family deacetylase [Streptacidiphilus sp. P02-A3a]